MATMILMAQGDKRWANVTIGKTALMLKNWGCTITALCSMLSWAGYSITPDKVAKIPGLFDGNGRIIWGNIEKSFAKMGIRVRFVWRQYGRDDKKIKASLTGKDTFALLEVNNGKHWTGALAAVAPSNYQIHDPIDGKKKLVFKAYPNITGSAHFTKY